MPIDPDSHDSTVAALAAADPAAGIALDSDTSHHFLSATLDASTRPAPKKRKLTIAAAGVAGLLAIAMATPAVADGIGYVAQTGLFGPDLSDSDDSEWIQLGAPDYVDYAVTLYPDYARLPAGYDQTRFAELVAESTAKSLLAGEESATIQATGIVEMFEYRARCAWQVEWLDANAAGDATRQANAATILVEAATWPATVITDGGGIVKAHQAVARAAQARDRSTVAEAVTTHCPSLPAGARK